MTNTLESYLVAVGFKADDASYRKLVGQLSSLDKTIKTTTGGWVKAFAGAAATVITALNAVAGSTLALMGSVAQADLGYKKLGMRMYMTRESAKRMKEALDALGTSAEDVAWLPELRERYFALIAQERALEPGGEKFLKLIRDTQFEFTRLKVSFNYLKQAVVVNLAKSLPLQDLKKWLAELNASFMKKIPVWSAKIADLLGTIIKLAASGARAVKDLLSLIGDLWNKLSPTGQAVVSIATTGAGFLALGAIPIIGPFLQACILAGTVIGGLLIIIEDFYGYLDGKESSRTLKPIWEFFTKGAFHSWVEAFKSAIDIAKQAVSSLFDIVKKLFDLLVSFPQSVAEDFKNLSATIGRGLSGFAEGAKNIGAKIGSGIKGAYDKVTEGLFRLAHAESGGNYQAVNKRSGARGAYQIMPRNWGPWKKEAGLSADAPMTPENQDKVARFKYEQYLKRYNGNEQLAAVAWYAGPRYADLLQKGKPLPFSLDAPKKGGNPSVNGYLVNTTGREWQGNAPNPSEQVATLNQASTAAALPGVSSVPGVASISNAVSITINLPPGADAQDVARKYGVNPNQLFRWRKLLHEAGLYALGADQRVVAVSEIKGLQAKVRDLERLLGRKTMEVEILREAIRIAREKKLLLRGPFPSQDGLR